MLDRDDYDGWNKNDEYRIKQDVIILLDELDEFDKRLKDFLGPKKTKAAGVDSRRSCRIMRDTLKRISDKIQMTKQDYESNYEDN